MSCCSLGRSLEPSSHALGSLLLERSSHVAGAPGRRRRMRQQRLQGLGHPRRQQLRPQPVVQRRQPQAGRRRPLGGGHRRVGLGLLAALLAACSRAGGRALDARAVGADHRGKRRH
jgi:hypothetical protein